MKDKYILIVSDTHGYEGNLKEVYDKIKPIDMLIHLGDFEGGENRIRSMVSCPVEMVPGNNDYMSNLASEKLIRIGNYKVLLTHGHRQHVYYNLNNLLYLGLEKEADVVMFGHTHRPIINEDNRITIINPGSISQPRQASRKPSYAIMKIDENGLAHYSIIEM